MATFTTTIDKGTRVANLGDGIQMRVVEVTLSPASTDYSNGVALQSNAAKMGLRRVLMVTGAAAKSSNGSTLGVTFNYNTSTGKLQGWNASATETAASNLGDGCVIRMIVIGA